VQQKLHRQCERYGTSRNTGCTWCTRRETEGQTSLLDHSRGPHASPAATEAAVIDALLALRQLDLPWGSEEACGGPRPPRANASILAPSTDAALATKHRCISRLRRCLSSAFRRSAHGTSALGRQAPKTLLEGRYVNQLFGKHVADLLQDCLAAYSPSMSAVWAGGSMRIGPASSSAAMFRCVCHASTAGRRASASLRNSRIARSKSARSSAALTGPR
jgi:hypothetical protein